MKALANAPAGALLSPTVMRMATGGRPENGSTSPIVAVLASRSASFGKVRVGLGVGGNERKIGASPLGLLGWPAGPRSHSSQA